MAIPDQGDTGLQDLSAQQYNTQQTSIRAATDIRSNECQVSHETGQLHGQHPTRRVQHQVLQYSCC